MNSTHPPGIELLEDRIAPAGVVTVVYSSTTGELTLTGDVDDNNVAIFQAGLNQYRIQGNAGTLLTGNVAAIDIGKLTKLTFTGAAGADTLSLENLKRSEE